MPPQARVGDASQVPADAHGCPGCPHMAVGPAISGSSNVLTNGRPSVRVGDKGIHAACCGPNMWAAKTGSRSVLINGRNSHRLSDMVKHCGGTGWTIQGSANVIVGDNAGLRSNIEQHKTTQSISQKHKIQYKMMHRADSSPVRFCIKILDPSGRIISKRSDSDGKIIISDIDPGTCKIIEMQILDEVFP